MDRFTFKTYWAAMIKMLPEAEQLQVYNAVIAYASMGMLMELSGQAQHVFDVIRADVDVEMEKAKELSAKRKEAGRKGGEAKAGVANAKQLPSKCQANAIANAKQNSSICYEEKETEKERDEAVSLLPAPSSLPQAEKEKDKEKETFVGLCDSDGDVRVKVTAMDYARIWNEHCPSFPKVLSMNDDRRKRLKLRLQEMQKITGRPPGEIFTECADRLQASDFTKDGSWCTFDWLVKNPNNWLKVYEGNYDNKNGYGAKHTGPPGRSEADFGGRNYESTI